MRKIEGIRFYRDTNRAYIHKPGVWYYEIPNTPIVWPCHIDRIHLPYQVSHRA